MNVIICPTCGHDHFIRSNQRNTILANNNIVTHYVCEKCGQEVSFEVNEINPTSDDVVVQLEDRRVLSTYDEMDIPEIDIPEYEDPFDEDPFDAVDSDYRDDDGGFDPDIG